MSKCGTNNEAISIRSNKALWRDNSRAITRAMASQIEVKWTSNSQQIWLRLWYGADWFENERASGVSVRGTDVFPKWKKGNTECIFYLFDVAIFLFCYINWSNVSERSRSNSSSSLKGRATQTQKRVEVTNGSSPCTLCQWFCDFKLSFVWFWLHAQCQPYNAQQQWLYTYLYNQLPCFISHGSVKLTLARTFFPSIYWLPQYAPDIVSPQTYRVFCPKNYCY